MLVALIREVPHCREKVIQKRHLVRYSESWTIFEFKVDGGQKDKKDRIEDMRTKRRT